MRSLVLIVAALLAQRAPAPRVQTAPTTLVSAVQVPLTRAQAGAFINGPASGTAPNSCSARVDMRDLDFDVVRVVNPYTDPAPLTSIRAELCGVLRSTYTIENWGVFTPLVVALSARAVRFEASFSPTFAPGFEIVAADFLIVADTFVVPTFDGVADLAGPSTHSTTFDEQRLGVALRSVNPGAEAFFRSPFAVYLRSTSTPWYVTTTGGASFYELTTTVGGDGLVLYWNG